MAANQKPIKLLLYEEYLYYQVSVRTLFWAPILPKSYLLHPYRFTSARHVTYFNHPLTISNI